MRKEFTLPDGERLVFRKSGAETDGQLLEMAVTYKPNSKKPPEHYHPYQEERFEVLRGSFHASIGGEESSFEPGDKFIVPANTPHWMYQRGDEGGELLWQVRPALRTQSFFETIWGLQASQGRDIHFLQMAVILNEYRDEFRLSSLPYGVQRILLPILAFIGRTKGYRPRYARYSAEE
jgi:quercetin dioxygenase-like cupin family protein